MARYLTTTLPYVNADPHIGFALELVEADALVRLWRSQGEEVFFNTGSDEHGQKIYDAAEKAGEDITVYINRYAQEFEKLKSILNLDNPTFIRTSSPEHIKAAQEMWRRCDAAGDIEKKSYTGLYCVGCEAFKSTRELNVEGQCLIHPHLKLVELQEENYFFKFSKYQEKLLEYLQNPQVILPEWRRQEAITFVQDGLEDFSISRERKSVKGALTHDWGSNGIVVPGDKTQVMYVWFDALTSYISTLGWPSNDSDFEKFWVEGKTLQMAGKDQVRFQSLMWQAMLMSADIKNTDQIFYHGFINSEGQKMSKSLGNVISPYEVVNKYGTDAARYILLRHIHPSEDSDVTWERLHEWYTANLTNGLGNLVARVMKLAETHLTEPIPMSDDDSGNHTLPLVEKFEFNTAVDYIWHRIQLADERITSEEPFRLVKVDEQKGKAIIAELARELYSIATLLNPFMPATSEIIKAAVLANKKPDNLFPRI